MKHEGLLLTAVSLLTLTVGGIVFFSSPAPIAQTPSEKQVVPLASPCLGDNCVTLEEGTLCKIIGGANYVACVPGKDKWGNYDECEHPIYIPLLCRHIIEDTKDVRLYQCNAPPPKGKVGPHSQWMQEITYKCGTKCRAEFVTKKPHTSGEE